MKVFVFSDSHLSDKYDEEFYNWVKYWADKADTIVICGDFWDKFLCTFDEFFNSKWKDTLFTILNQKDVYYAYGNHDPITLADLRVNEFSKHQDKGFDIKIGEKVYRFEHGHLFGNPLDPGPFRFLGVIGNRLQKLILKIWGFKSFKIFKSQNRIIKKMWAQDERFLVCGHVHYGERGENFKVLGPSGFGLLYGLMIEDNNIYEIEKYEKRK